MNISWHSLYGFHRHIQSLYFPLFRCKQKRIFFVFPVFFLKVTKFCFFLIIVLSEIFFTASEFLLPGYPTFLHPYSLLKFPCILQLLFSTKSHQRSCNNRYDQTYRNTVRYNRSQNQSKDAGSGRYQHSHCKAVSFCLCLCHSLIQNNRTIFISGMHP